MGLKRVLPHLSLLILTPMILAVGLVTFGFSSPTPSNCQPGVQNQYPVNATAGEEVVITTTVTSGCFGPDISITQVIVNILPQNSSEILSTAPASPAMNTVTAPGEAGPWPLVVQVFWNGNPTAGNFEIFETAITINILRR